MQNAIRKRRSARMSVASYGYEPIIVAGSEPAAMHQRAAVLDKVVEDIHPIQQEATGNIHVRGFNEEGTTTPFDMVVLNKLDRFHPAMDVIERAPELGPKAGSPERS
jgi:phosphoketolase